MPLRDGPKAPDDKDALLSPEEFDQRQNNFGLYFAGKPGEHMMGDIYRGKEAFQKCLAENSEFAALADELYGQEFLEYTIDKKTQQAVPRQVAPELKQKLYKAYTMMRLYVKKDWELFE
jgi:hypothetical protein